MKFAFSQYEKNEERGHILRIKNVIINLVNIVDQLNDIFRVITQLANGSARNEFHEFDISRLNIGSYGKY